MALTSESVTEFTGWQDKLGRFREYIEHSRKTSEIFRMNAKEDYGFAEGPGQWDQKTKDDLDRQGRPALVMNAIFPIIKLISGQERSSRLGITFKPRGLDDDAASLIANASYRFASDIADIVYEVSHSFLDMICVGRGFLHTGIGIADPTDPLGEIFARRFHPLSGFWDPAATRYDMQDGKYFGIGRWIDEDALRLHYPGPMSEVKPGEWLSMPAEQVGEQTINQHWRETRTGQIRLMELHYKVQKKAYFVMTSTGEIQKFDDEGAAKEAIDQIQFMATQSGMPAPELNLMESIVAAPRVAHITWWKILKDMDSPFDHQMYPIVPFTAYNIDEEVMGEVRSLKDPQREKNKRWSQMLHMINTMAKGGWKIPKGSVSATQLSKWGTEAGKPGFYFEYNSMVGEPKEIQGQNIPTSFVNLMLLAEEETRKISGAHGSIQGMAEGDRQSGKAIGKLQQGAAMTLSPLFDNLVRSQKILGKQVLGLVKQFYPPSKVLEILGVSDREQLAKTQMDVTAFIKRVFQSKFDVVIDVTPLLGSDRERQFSQVMSMMEVIAKAGMPPGPAMIKLALSVSDFPNKEAYLAELQVAEQQMAQQGQQGGMQGATQ